MKGFLVISFLLTVLQAASIHIGIKFTRQSSDLTLATVEVVNKYFNRSASNMNFIIPEKYSNLVENVVVRDFLEELTAEHNKNPFATLRLETSKNLLKLQARRRLNTVFVIETFEGFKLIFDRITPQLFWLNGNYLVVLVDGEIAEVQEIFKLMWSRKISNVIVIFEAKTVLMKTFFPFRHRSCSDTQPVIINEFKSGSFVNGIENCFPEKLNNLHDCPIRFSVSNTTGTPIMAQILPNGTVKLQGSDIDMLLALEDSLNFKVNYTFIGDEGFFFSNGSAQGPLKALLDDDADVSIGNLWLKLTRLNFFDATVAYSNDYLMFVVPPGRDLTSIEKLIYPFSTKLWMLMLGCYSLGLIVIFIINRQPMKVRNFVFGDGVQYPYLNLFIGLIGLCQTIIPKGSFARFLLMTFLLFSLVMRTLYQGAFFKLMKSNEQTKEVQSVDEMMRKDFKIYVYMMNTDMYRGTDAMNKRFALGHIKYNLSQ